MDAERLAALRMARLRAVAPLEGAEETLTAFGPTLLRGSAAWASIVDRAALVGAVVWALRNELRELDVVLDPDETTDPTAVSTTAALLGRPVIRVWLPTGDTLDEVRPVRSAPVTMPSVPERCASLSAVLREHGVDPVVELDAIVGEIAGLEVARIDLAGDPPVLSVGVGRFDRDLNEMLGEADRTEPVAQLVTAVRAVSEHRRPGARPHPLNRLRRERWLRSAIVAEPGLVDCTALVPLPPLAVEGLRTPSPAPALQAGDDPVLVVCSAGVDPTLVPDAAEMRERYAPDARILLVVPTGDDYPVTHEIAAALRAPASVVSVAAPWATG